MGWEVGSMACEAMADHLSNYHVLVEAPTELCPNSLSDPCGHGRLMMFVCINTGK